MEPTMTLFYKQHPTLLPVVFMALLVVGCTSTKVERLKAKPHPTQQDIDFVRAHTTFDGDYAWCTYAEIDLQFDSLRILREKLQKSKEHQQFAPLFEEEWELFQRYQEACIDAFYVSKEIGEIGSGVARSINTSDIASRVCQQYLLADRGVLSQLCKAHPNTEAHHQTITPKMIDDAYACMMEAQKDCEYCDSASAAAYSRENKQSALRKEQNLWNQWMSYRAALSEKLPEKVRPYFDNGTNNAMRVKLIELKNQYQDIGIIGGDIERCHLPADCSDKDMMEYPSFHHVWNIYGQHLDDKNWTDWKRSEIYDK
ncbi:MAG: hypothetical protein IKN98_06135 [Bacteroidales bacterium]|nr:hypothetical protein [Bacteroidales bacterium]